MRELLIFGSFVLVPLAVQTVILFLTENRFQFLRYAVPVITGIVAAAVFLSSFTVPLWVTIAVPVAFFACLTVSVLVLLGWMLAWFVYYLIKYLTKRKASDTQ